MEEGNDANKEENLDDCINRDEEKLIGKNEDEKTLKNTILEHLGVILFIIGISIIVFTV